MKWSALIRQRRENLKLPQMELAVQAGVSLPSIQNMEAGRAKPSLKTLEKVLQCLGMELEFRVVNEKATAALPDESLEDSKEESGDLGDLIMDVGSDLTELTKGSAMERAGKLVKIFEKIADSRKR